MIPAIDRSVGQSNGKFLGHVANGMPRADLVKRWKKQPRAEYFYDVESFRHVPTVSDHEATDTGLLDANGDTIWRAPETVGFIREDTFANLNRNEGTGK